MTLLPTVGYSTLFEARGLGTAVMRREEEGEEESRAELTEAISRLLQLSGEAHFCCELFWAGIIRLT